MEFASLDRHKHTMVFCNCPPQVEELAEDYCLDRLDSNAAEAFEDHYLTCPQCACLATEIYDFIQAFRGLEAV